MRRLAFILTLLGIFSLILFLNQKPIILNNTNNFQNSSLLIPNQKLLIQGQVLKETLSKDQKTLHLNNKLKLQCPNPCPTYLNKNISALTILEKYNNKNYLKILKIKILN